MGAFQVLISYSHDDATQRARVLALAELLREANLDVGIDRMVPPPQEGWPDWMDTQVKDARGVVIAVNPGWHRRASGAEANPELGKGVAYEWRLLKNHNFVAKEDPRLVLWASTADNARYVPKELNHRPLHVFDPHNPDPAAFDAIVRDLKGLPEIQPRPLPTLPIHDHGFDFRWDVYLSYPDLGDIPEWVKGAFLPRIIKRLATELGYPPRVYDPWQAGERTWTPRRQRALADSRILLWLSSPSPCPLVDAEHRSFLAREQALGISDDPARTRLILPVLYCGDPNPTYPPQFDLYDHTAVLDADGNTHHHIGLREVLIRIAAALARQIRAAEGWYEHHPVLSPGAAAPKTIPPLGSLA